MSSPMVFRGGQASIHPLVNNAQGIKRKNRRGRYIDTKENRGPLIFYQMETSQGFSSLGRKNPEETKGAGNMVKEGGDFQ